MPNPVTDYEALIDAAVASGSRANVQAVKDGFDPFVSALLAHLTAHFVKHLDAAEAEELLKPEAERNRAALDWSAQLRAALISAEADGRTPTTALAELVSPDG
jgi:hypothetical protein